MNLITLKESSLKIENAAIKEKSEDTSIYVIIDCIGKDQIILRSPFELMEEHYKLVITLFEKKAVFNINNLEVIRKEKENTFFTYKCKYETSNKKIKNIIEKELEKKEKLGKRKEERIIINKENIKKIGILQDVLIIQDEKSFKGMIHDLSFSAIKIIAVIDGNIDKTKEANLIITLKSPDTMTNIKGVIKRYNLLKKDKDIDYVEIVLKFKYRYKIIIEKIEKFFEKSS